MQEFTQTRTADTTDELWHTEHYPVYTQGQAGKPEHLLNPTDIDVVKTDRGGQITYHGPGQLVLYTLIDLKRKNIGIRQLIDSLENSVIKLLADFDLGATSNKKAPGVYINNKKICSVGLRVKRNCSYHGLSFNVNMDLAPFDNINVCGYPDLKMTQLIDYGIDVRSDTLAEKLATNLRDILAYKEVMVL